LTAAKVNFGRAESTPRPIAGVLAALAFGSLAHVLVSTVRRRRRDLAVLKALGFTRRQVMMTVAVQATVVLGIALLIAVPLGIAAAGRFGTDALTISASSTSQAMSALSTCRFT
jgi:ABC-type antimicrobial peptide transport system permease subunit